ncbi:MAG: phytanoyl-CoA dioxygenase family protein [Gammaproteobacteria bacterium]|nr:phytanoyl-CoA dioxygenase family protein [Gammaproteobacteria bacterium]
MKDKFYGSLKQTAVHDDIDLHVEEISIKGYSVVTGLIDAESLDSWRERIDDIYLRQEADFGKDELARIQETDACRAPLLYDLDFVKLAAHPKVLSIVDRILGDWYILNLQNAVINRPETEHHQSSWHRDLPHQNFVISQPLAINALYAIDDFSELSGGTCILPLSHKTEVLPSDEYIERNQLSVVMPAGSAVVFDSMLLHRAGVNKGNSIRRALNHLYTRPILKQQYDFPRALGDQINLDSRTEQLLGYTSQVPVDDKAWRHARARRMG